MKFKHVVLAILAVLFVFTLTAAAPFEGAPPGDQTAPMAVLALTVTALVTVLVAEGVKAFSCKYKDIPGIEGWGARVTVLITGAVMLWAGQGLSYLPPDLQNPAALTAAGILTLLTPFLVYWLQKQFIDQTPVTPATIPRQSAG